MEEERLDKILVEKGLVSNRTRAESIIRTVGVQVNGKLITKSGKKVPIDAEIRMLEEELPYVSRGALKLKKALDHWKIDCTNKVFLDLGASTGGFTEVLLEYGASKIFAVDVGSKQLHSKLLSDKRVINLEKTHVRDLTKNIITEQVDGCVIDLSFISLEKILPFIHPFLKNDAQLVILIKPQFEVGKENVEKGGIVRNKSLFPALIENIKNHAKINNLAYKDHIDSPILGGDGNHEFLGWFQKMESF